MAADTLFSKVPIELLEDPDVDAYAVAVYAALRSKCDFGSEDGARVSDGTAADLAGCSAKTFQRRRQLLRDLGWIDWTGKYGAVNAYVVRDQPLSESPRTRDSQSPVGHGTGVTQSLVEDKTGDSQSPVAGGPGSHSPRGRSQSPRTGVRVTDNRDVTENPHREHAGVHPRTNGDSGGGGKDRGRACPSCGTTTLMPEGPCAGCRGRSIPPGPEVDDLEDHAEPEPELPDPEDVVQVGDDYPTSPLPGRLRGREVLEAATDALDLVPSPRRKGR